MAAPGPPLPVYRLIRPGPLGSVNSVSATPTLRSTHSTASTEPVATANLGMSPSLWLRGKRDIVGSTAVLAQEAVVGMTICPRQRPDTMTTGMLVPPGPFWMVKVPSTAVVAPTSGEPRGA